MVDAWAALHSIWGRHVRLRNQHGARATPPAWPRTCKGRRVWPHEAANFTPWLAEHLSALSDVLGVELELQSQEAPVGEFSLDTVKMFRSDAVRAGFSLPKRTQVT